jgi:glyoxylase-like metal-dependent hydrolase (beta-lactamase superfamily II)
MLHPLQKITAAALLAGLAAFSFNASAAGPMVKTQAPGYYRVMLGDFEVTALSDGTVKLPVRDLLTRTTPARVDAALKRSFLANPVETSVNAYLINTGSKLVLVDTGAAGLFGPTLGSLQANLKAAGYQPEQVDEIYITHMHPDHVGGLVGRRPRLPQRHRARRQGRRRLLAGRGQDECRAQGSARLLPGRHGFAQALCRGRQTQAL